MTILITHSKRLQLFHRALMHRMHRCASAAKYQANDRNWSALLYIPVSFYQQKDFVLSGSIGASNFRFQITNGTIMQMKW